MTNWQPIETAPKDEWILGGSSRSATVRIAWSSTKNGWVDNLNCLCDPDHWTHWQPLPAPPQDSSP